MNIFWFRRDLRIDDNTALHNALQNGTTLPIFIFDDDITDKLKSDDPRLNFIYDQLQIINQELQKHESGVTIYKGKPLEVWESLIKTQKITAIYFNHDYEPYARTRDKSVYELLTNNGIAIKNFKDQVIFEKLDITKNDGKPYTVYTPYKNKWLAKYESSSIEILTNSNFKNSAQPLLKFPTKEALNIQPNDIKVLPWDISEIKNYDETRNFPSLNSTSKLGPHLRFGTVSIRKLVEKAQNINAVFLSELIWREFFTQILWNFPASASSNFKPQYNLIEWINNSDDFEKWTKGKTGYPIVDAGMKELNKTGYMHNRVRMITASFLCKHLLIDWKWGEAYFAEKLLDYEMASNVGNWQWAAGTGCDAAPYFRVFNPYEQVKKFDKDLKYIQKWVPNYADFNYPAPMVEHKVARLRALDTYKQGLALAKGE